MKKLLFFCLLSCLLCLILVSCGETKTTEANTTEPETTSKVPGTTSQALQTTEAPFSQVGTPITITPEEVERYSQNENSDRHGKHHLLNAGDGSVIVVEYAEDGESIIRAERFEDRTGKATVRDLAQIKDGMTVFDVVAIAGLPQGVTSGILGIIYVSDTQEEGVVVQTDMAGNVVSVSSQIIERTS